MQVSSKLFNQQQVKQFSDITSDLQTIQGKISSGKNILVASDDPVGSVELSGFKVVKEQLDQYCLDQGIDQSMIDNFTNHSFLISS